MTFSRTSESARSVFDGPSVAAGAPWPVYPPNHGNPARTSVVGLRFATARFASRRCAPPPHTRSPRRLLGRSIPRPFAASTGARPLGPNPGPALGRSQAHHLDHTGHSSCLEPARVVDAGQVRRVTVARRTGNKGRLRLSQQLEDCPPKLESLLENLGVKIAG